MVKAFLCPQPPEGGVIQRSSFYKNVQLTLFNFCPLSNCSPTSCILPPTSYILFPISYLRFFPTSHSLLTTRSNTLPTPSVLIYSAALQGPSGGGMHPLFFLLLISYFLPLVLPRLATPYLPLASSSLRTTYN